MSASDHTAPPEAARAADRLRASLGQAWLLAGVAYLAVFVLTLFAGYWALFSQFRPWDDEGFFEYGIRLFLQGHHLYSGFYSDYGPFSYELWGLLFKVAGKTISTDSGRLIQVGIWAFSSLALGIASHRVTRRLAIGISVQALSFSTLWVMDNEPMHPGGLIVLLLAIALCVVVFGLERAPRRTLFALGALVACVGLTKVNQGGYAVIALAFATIMAHPSLRGRAWLRRSAGVVVVGVSPVLMNSNLGQAWGQRYAALAVGGTLALWIVAAGVDPTGDRGSTPAGLSAGRFTAWWVSGMLAAAIVVVGIVLLLGTSLTALVSDILIQPISAGSILSTEPAVLGSNVIVWALLAVAGAWGLSRSGALGLASQISGLATGLPRLLVGIAIWLSVASIAPLTITPNSVFALAMVLVWVAAVPPRGARSPHSYFIRLFIVALALLEALDAYPVAGSQVWFGSVLFLVCGGICVADGWADLEHWWRQREASAGSPIELSYLLAAGAAALAVAFVYNAEQNASSYRDLYTANVPLHANGASRLRLGLQQDLVIEQVVVQLLEHCKSLLTIPGRDSFNEWSGLPTPLDLIVLEHGPLTMTAAEQRQAVSAERTTPGLCVLLTTQTGPGASTGPAVQYITDHYRQIASASGTSISGNYAYSIEIRGKRRHRRPRAVTSSARRR